MFEVTTVTCPYCGEQTDLMLDPENAEASFVEDCSVCCRPMEIRVSPDERGQPRLRGVFREDE